MSEVRISSRYAKAALDLAKDKNLIEDISNDFSLILETLKASKEFRLLFKSPVISRTSKITILDSVLKKKIHKESLNYLHFLVDKGRENLIREILGIFFKLKNDHFGLLEAKVSGFHQLKKNQLDTLKKRLETLTKKKVNINFDVNKDLLGGLMVQVEDKVLDGSVRRRIEMLKEYLAK
jgi:F-type H+-transporting ATPase subunit delta